MSKTEIKTNISTDLVENKELRNSLIERIEVLNKVKELFLLPKLDVMTVKQVADYYEVDIATIKKVYQRNKSEIDEDGTLLNTPKDLLKGHFVPLVKTQTKVTFKISDNITLEVPNRGIRCFSQRAILRIGMLLRDSKIAQEVRTQLLNTVEKATVEQKTSDIDEELAITNKIGMAIIEGDFEKFKEAVVEGFAFKNRHIDELNKENEQIKSKNDNLTLTNKALTQEVTSWDDRAIINSLIRTYAHRVLNNDNQYAWNIFYKELLYKEGINLNARWSDKRKSKLSYVRNKEWDRVLSVAVAMCENKKIDTSEILAKKTKMYGKYNIFERSCKQ